MTSDHEGRQEWLKTEFVSFPCFSSGTSGDVSGVNQKFI